jgi:calcineurin-like phosphoesterase family protein
LGQTHDYFGCSHCKKIQQKFVKNRRGIVPQLGVNKGEIDVLFSSDHTWFTSDEHFFHRNICKEDFFNSGFKRPWRNEKEMRKNMINRHNSKVKKDDWVIHGGDFAFTSNLMVDRLRPILENLNGNHILVLGNHDEIKPFKYVNIGFTIVTTSFIMEMDGWNIVVNHDPSVRCVVPKETLFLCGHIHDLFKALPEKLTVNIGVDVWDYYPINLTHILEELNK